MGHSFHLAGTKTSRCFLIEIDFGQCNDASGRAYAFIYLLGQEVRSPQLAADAESLMRWPSLKPFRQSVSNSVC